MADRRHRFSWNAYRPVESGPSTALDRKCLCFPASSAFVLLILVEIRPLPRGTLLRSVQVFDETTFQTPASSCSLPKQLSLSTMMHQTPPTREALLLSRSLFSCASRTLFRQAFILEATSSTSRSLSATYFCVFLKSNFRITLSENAEIFLILTLSLKHSPSSVSS